MHDPTIHSSSFDLAPTGSRRIMMWAGIVGGLAVLGVVAVVIFKLVFTSPGAAACDHFEALSAKEPVEHRAELVNWLERKVESRVVAYDTVGTKRVDVSGCRDALATMDKALPHGQFTRLTKCMETARTAASAVACL